jgi:tetratricopeptide (TPR) repeat protein
VTGDAGAEGENMVMTAGLHARRMGVARLCGMIAGALMLLATPASGASQKAHDDCNAGDPDRNIAGCTRVLEDRRESKQVRGIAYVGRAIAWYQKGHLDRAIADLTQAVRLNPKDALAYNNLGSAWREKGDLDQAITNFTHGIHVNPLPRNDINGRPFINIYLNRAGAWKEKGDLDRAIADYDQANRLEPNDPQIYFIRALAWQEKGDVERAIADFTAAIGLDPQYANAYYNRGHALLAMGERERAMADLNEAMRLALNGR